MKITKNDALGASGGRCGASRFQNGSWAATRLRKGCHFWRKVGFWAPFWTQVAPVCPTSATRRTPDLEFATILAEKTDFGCHFGPQWILKGVTKSHCLTPCSKKNVKMTPKNDVKKHNEL